MRVLGVDFGFSRIGIAAGEAELGVFSARPALKASGTLKKDAETIAAKAAAEEVASIVVGHPLDAEGGGRMARICAQLADHLRSLGWTVHMVDESLTSVAAHADLRDAGMKASQRRRFIDGEAAVRILERWADAQV